MKKQLMTVMLGLVALSTAQAKIGQTPQEVIQDARLEKAVGVQWIEFLGKQLLQVQYHDDVVCHLFGADGREIAFYYYATKGLKPEDVDKLQRRYRTTWRGTGTDGGVFTWESANGLWMAAERHEGYDYLAIFDASRIQEMPEIRNAVPTPAWASAPVATPTPASSPTIAQTPAQDCLPFATEAYARLKTTTHWAAIAGMSILTKDTNEKDGHAVVFFQPTAGSNVYMYDRNGSFGLPTHSHDLKEIMNAVNQAKLPPYTVQSARWIDGNQGSQPVYSSTTGPTSADEQTHAYQMGYLLGRFGAFAAVLGLYAWVIVICFLKGKGGFGVLGIFGFFIPFISWAAIIGACRIAKPTSWWAGKKYSPKKMDIAHGRFTPFYNQAQEAVPVIIDDPVERALERVRRNNQ
jgi:hypothetical protein